MGCPSHVPDHENLHNRREQTGASTRGTVEGTGGGWAAAGSNRLGCTGHGITESGQHGQRNSFAIEIGPNATASATGSFDGAIANGATNTTGQNTLATSNGNSDFAYASGPDVAAQSVGTHDLALA